MRVASIIISALGLVGMASYIIAALMVPVVLYKGFKQKTWKLGKIAIAMFVGGILLQIVALMVLAAIKSV